MLSSSLYLPPSSSSFLCKTPHPQILSPSPHLYIKFRTSHRENLRYLKSLGIITSTAVNPQKPLNHIIDTVNFLKSKGISDSDFSRLAFFCPQLFSPTFNTLEIEPTFTFLTEDLRASTEESRGLIVNCPELLLSNVEYCLKPTLNYLMKLGVERLNVPSKLHAHLLNTRLEKLKGKMKFLKGIGLGYYEAKRVCGRMPAIFGYSVEENLRPKYEFLVGEMERGLEELEEFPQYFGYSLQKRIAPRHWHLKKRNKRIKLNRMLMWNDHKFYSKWK